MPPKEDYSHVKAVAFALSLPLKSVVYLPTASAATQTPLIGSRGKIRPIYSEIRQDLSVLKEKQLHCSEN